MNVLVTGATGFLGRRACQLLRERGFAVFGVGRNRSVGAALEKEGTTFVAADLEAEAEARDICRGMDFVVHAAALSAPWGSRARFRSANVRATQSLLGSCRRHGVKRLVHVSTSSVYFQFKDAHGLAETSPLPARFASEYTASKYEAELAVSAAAADGLPAVILRPRGIFGPGDAAIVPRLVAAQGRGVLRIIGDGRAIVDLTYVDNVAHAVALALSRPVPPGAPVFNITNGQPVALWSFINRIFEGVGLPRVTGKLPYRLAYVAALASELAARTFRRSREPILTRYGVGLLARSQTLDITKARSVLGYAPIVDMNAGIEAVIADLARSRGRHLLHAS